MGKCHPVSHRKSSLGYFADPEKRRLHFFSNLIYTFAPRRFSMIQNPVRTPKMKTQINVCINGQERTDEVEPRLLLIHYLREVIGLKGPHIGCETSICGACTVALNGKTVKSCALLAVQADGQDIVTVEGLATDGQLHPVQEAFWNEHGPAMRLLHARHADDYQRAD